MASADHLAQLARGVAEWNTWRLHNPDIRPELQDADLSRRVLSGFDLHYANLAGSNLFGTKLQGADLTGAFLLRTNLSATLLAGADLSHAHLGDADLRQAMLNRAILYHCDVKGAIFNDVEFGGTVFSDLDLSSAIGLDKVRHTGPSSLSFDTILRSQGKLPREFLLGTGIPSSIVDSIAGTIATTPAYQFYSLFISHSSADTEFATQLYSDLRRRGALCWFSPKDMKGGEKLLEQIEKAISDHRRLLLILSEDSMQSEWVKTELHKARQKEVLEGHRVLFPIRLVEMSNIQSWKVFDSDTGTDLAREVREYFIPDFTNWRNAQTYDEAFERLLRDLST